MLIFIRFNLFLPSILVTRYILIKHSQYIKIMERKNILNILSLGGHLSGAMLYLVVFYTILMCMMSGSDVSTVVDMNSFGEAWWEIFLFPLSGLFIFAGLVISLRQLWKNLNKSTIATDCRIIL